MFQAKSFLTSLSVALFLSVTLLLLHAPAIASGADAGPATAPAQVDPIPAGWKAGQFDTPSLKTGKNDELQAHFELHSEPKGQGGDQAFADWAKRGKVEQAKDSPMTERKETDLKASTIGGHDIFEYEITGNLFGSPLHYRVFFVPIRGVFCTLLCWTTPKHWEAAKPEFEKLVANLK